MCDDFSIENVIIKELSRQARVHRESKGRMEQNRMKSKQASVNDYNFTATAALN